MPKILIADDNKQISTVLSEYAKREGFVPFVAADGEEALELFRKHQFDVALLDVMMPKQDGFSVCSQIRKTSNLPIIMITARGEDYERIMGLDIGADDYIVKPFSPNEVLARIRAILRRITKTPENAELQKQFIYDNLHISLDNFAVSIGDQPISLTRKEIELLWLMSTNPNRVFSRDNLLDSVWGYDYYGDSRTVDSHIKRLRAKMEKIEHSKWQVKTIWGVGYKFETIPDEI